MTKFISQQTFFLMKSTWRRLEDVFPLCLQDVLNRFQGLPLGQNVCLDHGFA